MSDCMSLFMPAGLCWPLQERASRITAYVFSMMGSQLQQAIIQQAEVMLT